MVPNTNDQPSTKTNSMILKGRDISMGDNIIMPIDMSTLATTKSITRNGIKIRNPIWKAVFNSLVTKEGSRILKGISSLEFTQQLFYEIPGLVG